MFMMKAAGLCSGEAGNRLRLHNCLQGACGEITEETMNGILAEAVSKEPLDLDYFSGLVMRDKQARDDMVDLTLHHPHIMVYYHGYYILDRASGENPELFYGYWRDIAKLLRHTNTYHRQIGIVLLSNICKADTEHYFSESADDYFRCLYDPKILIGIFCVRYLKQIVRHKPEYRDRVAVELLAHHRKTPYTVKQEALLDFEILEVLEEQYGLLQDKDSAGAFIAEKTQSPSPKARKKALQLVKALGL